jgi:hypothetical protein
MVSLTRDVDTDFTRGKEQFTSKTFNSIYYHAFPPSFYHLLRFAPNSHKKKASACTIDRESQRRTDRQRDRCEFRDCVVADFAIEVWANLGRLCSHWDCTGVGYFR